MGVFYAGQDRLWRRRRSKQTNRCAEGSSPGLDGYEEVFLRFQKTIDASPASGVDRSGKIVLYAQYSDERDGAFSTFVPGLKRTLDMLEQLANLQVRNGDWLDAEDAHLRLVKGREIAFGLDHSLAEDTLGTLSAVLYYGCFEEVPSQPSASQETTDPTQDSIGCWAEASPVWRLANLARTYGQSYPLLFGVLGKALKHVGDEHDAKVALQLEVIMAVNRSGELRRSCDRCETSVTPETGRYVCKSCHEDTDLCEPCFKTRKEEQWQSHPCDDPAARLSDLQLYYAVRAPDEEAAAASGGDE
ncbi:hypothetical protein LTS15_011281 [Exophiala xenobiotica]|nr:hypothetical protein LTS15_011281 [Exophiala xenobiotica]